MPVSFRNVCCNIPACRRIVGREFCEPQFRHFNRRESRQERIERERRERGIQPF